MYLPSHFEENRDAVMHALVRAHPFGLLITREGEEPCADAVPFLIDAARGPHGTLVAHVARANPLWRHAQGQRVLVVFQGPQAYVSPSAYPSKAEHGKVVPTWNYVMVQARGTLRASEDARELHGIVSRLTDTHEAGRAAPWAVGDAPADYIEKMLGAIVAIEIPIATLVGKWKVSQNRSAADREGVAREFEASNVAMARQVRTPGVEPG
ncbi:MAG TPA: FMN-binding negative transcriptional regulator [Piscinibacter sp.]|uniref:FMN-binding negative transcriptional regulator n=1 Tax=Piscinibacter sp. TaxID=1903157 RepID=UPI002C8E1000|nr:FMN-binding negative transcriptional regulator [Piscinibacter sp.]